MISTNKLKISFVNFIASKRIKSKIILLLFINIIFSFYLPIQSSSEEKIDKKPTLEYTKKVANQSFYILGPGDVLNIKVIEESDLLDGKYEIDGDGFANLKRLKRIYISGLTINELEEILNKSYSEFVKNPNVDIQVNVNRPVKVYIDGEVISPGLYVLGGKYSETILKMNGQSNINLQSQSNTKSVKDYNYYPTVIDAIRESGGISNYANLEEVTITRTDSISNGSGRIKTVVNLMDTLTLKDTSQNIRILDGDTIYISKNVKPFSSQISNAIKFNINPKFINVFVAGRVKKSGKIKLSKNAVLSDAITLGGGIKTLRGKLRFTRFNSDGNVETRKFNYNKNAKRGTFKNPYLRDGDIIFIEDNLLTASSDVLGEITSPIRDIVSSWLFFKFIDL